LSLNEPIAPPHPPTQLPLADVLAWDETSRRLMLFRSALKRIKLDQFKRNALILAGNHLHKHPDPALRKQVEDLAQNPAESNLVRQTAQEVLRTLPPQR
jgi:epoxyqueuosine reductase QueG